MKKQPKRKMTKAMQARSARTRRMLSVVNLMITIVAIIECCVLLSYTTFSWIESTSSLVISTGADGVVSMNVSDNLNYQINMAPDAVTPADLNTFYNKTTGNEYQTFLFAKASSVDGGKTMYFPKKNNLSAANENGYRKGDTADYNISYTYMDFKLKNTSGMKKIFYFAAGSGTRGNADTSLFYVTGGTSAVNTAVENAMRISFEKIGGSNPGMKVYSYSSVTTSAVNSTSGSTASSITTTAISTDVLTNPPAASGIFETDLGDPEAEVAVRIWLEEKALGSAITAEQLKSVNIKINLRLKCDDIKYDTIYFDDYTFSNLAERPGVPVTEESDTYTMYFYVWNSNINGGRYVAYPMSQTDRDPNHPDVPRWVTACPVAYVFNNLTSNTTYYQNAFFGYGELPDTSTNATPSVAPKYRWNLSDIGYLAISGSGTSAELTDATKYISALGAAKGQASYSSTQSIRGYAAFSSTVTPTMVYFSDYTTAYTGLGYNVADSTKSNFQILRAKAMNDSTPTHNEILYASAYGAANSYKAVTMYYDPSTGFFKGYVPAAWKTGGTLRFRYFSGGYYTTTDTLHWAPAANSSDEATYTALGYTNTTVVTSLSNGTGVGTWGAAREISFSTELIDSTIASSNKYRVSIDGGATNFVWMIPDAARLRFSAYIPSTLTTVKFRRTVGSTNTDWTPTGVTDADITYYPVSNTAGYFHLAVLVDGTYDHLITSIKAETDATSGVSSTLTYSIGDGGATTDLLANPIETSGTVTRWYVPLSASNSTVTYVWAPYDYADNTSVSDTYFTYTHYLSDGMYYVITE